MRPLGVQPNTLFHPPSLLTQYLKTNAIVPCTCGLLVRQEVMKAVGGFDDTIQYMFEDQVLLAKFACTPLCLWIVIAGIGIANTQNLVAPKQCKQESIILQNLILHIRFI
ncbi:MAG: hypothetical protein HC773_19395 [Scytonema sp. CRU_2_7]|nr:hypothetical protein [Scytonema sp. CRU_2_7]